MKIILIGNYPKDHQESMQRFSEMLYSGFKNAGIKTEKWVPWICFGVFVRSTASGIGKWIGYVDKWILFPVVLMVRIFFLKQKKTTRFHICDHSNSPYLYYLPKKNTVVTCHDVIAIRSSLGYAGTKVDVSRTGVFYQRWILNNLKKAIKLAAVSNLTLQQLEELAGSQRGDKQWRVIYNGFNAHFHRMDNKEACEMLKKKSLEKYLPFVLHVGSKHARKNRKLLIDAIAILKERWDGNIIYAGEPVEDSLSGYAKLKGVENKIVSIAKPDHTTLNVLYNTCYAFVFPSYSEGFGWPPIEAQACGAPVIASNIEPLPEVGGKAALYADPFNAEEFAENLLKLEDNNLRNKMQLLGYENVKRFSTKEMIEKYLELHSNNNV